MYMTDNHRFAEISRMSTFTICITYETKVTDGTHPFDVDICVERSVKLDGSAII